jgi:hypothetical protein
MTSTVAVAATRLVSVTAKKGSIEGIVVGEAIWRSVKADWVGVGRPVVLAAQPDRNMEIMETIIMCGFILLPPVTVS